MTGQLDVKVQGSQIHISPDLQNHKKRMFMKYLDKKRFSEAGKHRRKYKGKRRFNYIKVK